MTVQELMTHTKIQDSVLEQTSELKPPIKVKYCGVYVVSIKMVDKALKMGWITEFGCWALLEDLVLVE